MKTTEKIRPIDGSLATFQSVDSVRAAVAGSGHSDRLFGANTRQDNSPGVVPGRLPGSLTVVAPGTPVERKIKRGRIYLDIDKHVKVTVLHCQVAKTKRGDWMHEVVINRTGEKYKLSERKLGPVK